MNQDGVQTLARTSRFATKRCTQLLSWIPWASFAAWIVWVYPEPLTAASFIPIASPPTPCQYGTATPLPNGKVLVAGGDFPSPVSKAAVYDPATGIWTNTNAM